MLHYVGHLLCPRLRRAFGNSAIRLPLRLSVPWHSCLGYRHVGCLQLSHFRPPEMCGLWTRPRTDIDPPRFLPLSNCHWGGISFRCPEATPYFSWPGVRLQTLGKMQASDELTEAQVRQLPYMSVVRPVATLRWTLISAGLVLVLGCRRWVRCRHLMS